MRFWRICRLRFAAAAATGEGARLYGGRWNSRGVRVVYASTSLALAAVETFVHLEPNLRPTDLVSIDGHIPDDVAIERLDLDILPLTGLKREMSHCAGSATAGYSRQTPPHCWCPPRPFTASGTSS